LALRCPVLLAFSMSCDYSIPGATVFISRHLTAVLTINDVKNICRASHTLVAAAYTVGSILLASFYLPIETLSVGYLRWLSWLSYTKYAMQAMSHIELHLRVWNSNSCAEDLSGETPLL
jgi:hypothetical protein